MAQGLLKSNRSRDGIAAILAQNIGDLEDDMWQLQQSWLTKANELTAFETQLSQAGIRVLNGPNLIKQPQFTSREVPTSTVIYDKHTIAAEANGGAATTYTITDENITASMVLFQVITSDYTLIKSAITASCSAGSAVISVPARSAHNEAWDIEVWICTKAAATLPYGEISRSYATSQVWLDSVANAQYAGQENDQISESVVTLTGNDIVTDADGTTYDKAVAFTVVNPPTNGWGNADKLIWYYGNRRIEMENGEPKYRRYGQIDEMEVGETYTLSCWARVTSGTKAMLWIGACPYNGQYIKVPNGYEYHEIEALGGEWQRVTFEFEFSPTGDQFYTYTNNNVTYQSPNWLKQVGFGVCRKYACTVQLCGFRLVKGRMWVTDTYSDLLAENEAIRARMTAAESALLQRVQWTYFWEFFANLASQEDGDSSTAAHAVGEILVVGTQLYRVTAAIAIGDSITDEGNGANVEAVTVAELIGEMIDDTAGNGATGVAWSADKVRNALKNIIAPYKLAAGTYYAGNIIIDGEELYLVEQTINAGSPIITSGVAKNATKKTVAQLLESLGYQVENKADKNHLVCQDISVGRKANTGTGSSSVAAGSQTEAPADQAQAFGTGTVADLKNMTAVGMYNTRHYPEWKPNTQYSYGDKIIHDGDYYECGEPHTSGTDFDDQYWDSDYPDSSSPVFVVGKGTSDNNRSDAMVVDRSGNCQLAGNLTLGNVTLTASQLQALKAMLS